MVNKNIENNFDIIIEYAHFWDWAPDWGIVKDIYENFPESFSVLTPFAYCYLEELIRSTTSEYGYEFKNEKGKEERRVGQRLIAFAIEENSDKIPYIQLLQEAKKYYDKSNFTDRGNNRNGVAHGYLPARFWKKEAFEELIAFIAEISKYAQF